MEYVEILLMCIVAVVCVFALVLFIAPFVGVIIIWFAKIIDIFCKHYDTFFNFIINSLT